MRRRLIFIAPLALLGMVLFVTIGGEIVMHLWNGCCRRSSGGARSPSGRRLDCSLSAGSCSEAFVSPVLIAPLFGSEWLRAGKP